MNTETSDGCGPDALARSDGAYMYVYLPLAVTR
jgi:hypothetical protein